jgi:glycosyltransferase involved in cell wall biosynthesis
MRVLGLVPYPLGRAPCQRYRIEQWAPYLQEQGIEVEFRPFASPELLDTLYSRGAYWMKALRLVVAVSRGLARANCAREFDAIYLHREASLVGPALIERLVWRRNPRLVYDFDDAIWVPYVSPRNRYFSYLKAPGKTRAICRMAAAVTVGNERLAEYARRFNSRVILMPSTVSLRHYRPRPTDGAGPLPVIGWTGSHSSAQYLQLLEAPLRELARRRRFRFRVIGLDGYGLDGVDVECRPWRESTEVEDLWPLDIGVMPLWEDPWTMGKCAMKAVQYMGIGIPAVVSPVGANSTVVQNGVTGLHATSASEWLDALGRLLDDESYRRRLGEAGRALVEREFSAEGHAPRLVELLRALA